MKICCNGAHHRYNSKYDMIAGVYSCILILTLTDWLCHSFTISSNGPTTLMRTERPSTGIWTLNDKYDRSCRNKWFLSSSVDDDHETTDAAANDANEDEDTAAVDISIEGDENSSAEEVIPEAVIEDKVMTETISTTATTRTKEENLSFLTSLGAITGRGEFMLQTRYRPSTQQQYRAVEKVVSELESTNPIVEPTSSSHIYGTWELLYSTTQLFRHSPFFMAGRAVCTTDDDIQKYNWFCDMHRAALFISQIQSVRQIITETNQMISEFEVNVGSIPFLSDVTPFKYSGGLPISITGAIVSTADITPTMDGTGWEIYMDTVQIKGSNIPFLRNILDNDSVALQSRALADVLEQTISSYQTPKPIFRTTYLDEQYRISRDMDDHIFVYVKTSNSTTPTNYQFVDADLGIGRLLEGFNDAITKLYI